jgi:hypothetical protein
VISFAGTIGFVAERDETQSMGMSSLRSKQIRN